MQPQSHVRTRNAFLFLLLTLAAAPSCGGPTGSSVAPANFAQSLDPSAGLDPHQGGQAEHLHLARLAWGRLVDVYDSTFELQRSQLVIGEEIQSDGLDFQLDDGSLTGLPSLTVLHRAGTPEFAAAFARLERGLVELRLRGLEASDLSRIPVVPRNAALVLQFDDLLDEPSVRAGALRLDVGTPPTQAFPARLIADPNHGGWVQQGAVRAFHSTRVIVDLAVSEAEAAQSAAGVEPTGAGLPPAASANEVNLALRLATILDPASGALQRIENLAGHGIAADGALLDPLSASSGLALGLRSGGAPGPGGDSFHGFLADTDPPRLIGRQPVSVSILGGGPLDFSADVDFAVDACASALVPRALLQLGGSQLVVRTPTGQPTGGSVHNVSLRLVSGPAPVSGAATLTQTWDPGLHAGLEACFVGFSQTSPASSLPWRGVEPSSTVSLRFSEPLDAASVGAFDGFALTRVPSQPQPDQYVVGEVSNGQLLDPTLVTFTPRLPLAHVQGQAESVFVDLSPQVRDLAGNALAFALPQVRFTLDPQAASEDTAGLAFRFQAADMLGNDGLPEFRGQFTLDTSAGVARPRPVTRFSALADPSQPVPGLMPILASGVQTPLSPLGSRLQSLWRYCDVGLSLLDESTQNVDIEHLYWSPLGGNVVADSFTLFEMSLSHSNRLPDESASPLSLLPLSPNSGLVTTFAQNQLDPIQDPLHVVHPRALGYSINPADKTIAPSGTPLMPFPLNRGIPVSQYQYYTWRDTGLQAKGAVGDSPGAELRIVCSVVLGQPAGCVGCPFTNASGPNPTPSIGLPLLMEFKAFPDPGALGLNALSVSLGINSSARPNFRAFSTGGVNTSGQTVTVDPDTAVVATGGYNPQSVPPGMATLPADNTWQHGQVDLVLRVSRMHSIWFDTAAANSSFAVPVVEPRASEQPAGTALQLAYRGASGLGTGVPPIQRDAHAIDPYGEAALCPSVGTGCALVPGTCNGSVAYFLNDHGWKASLGSLNGARFVQVRASFVSNTATNDVPVLSALGLSWRR